MRVFEVHTTAPSLIYITLALMHGIDSEITLMEDVLRENSVEAEMVELPQKWGLEKKKFCPFIVGRASTRRCTLVAT